jgi:hypothetical protein
MSQTKSDFDLKCYQLKQEHAAYLHKVSNEINSSKNQVI